MAVAALGRASLCLVAGASLGASRGAAMTVLTRSIEEVDEEVAAPEPEPSDVTRLKRRNGVATAMLAGALFGLRDVLESPKETAPVTVESSSEPTDIDSDGMSIPLDDQTTAVAPPQRNSRQLPHRRAPRRRRKKPS